MTKSQKIIKLLERFYPTVKINHGKYSLTVINDGVESFLYQADKNNLHDITDLNGSSGYITGSIPGMSGFVNNRLVYCKVAKPGKYDYAIKFSAIES
jgi:hypothetical protein